VLLGETLLWIREHVAEELPLAAGGFAAYVLHAIYHRIYPRLAGAAVAIPRRIVRVLRRRP
jgi:hypothetical protein